MFISYGIFSTFQNGCLHHYNKIIFSPSSKKDYFLKQNKWVFKAGPSGNEFLAGCFLVKRVQEARHSLRRLRELLSRSPLTISNCFCIFFVLFASTKDGPIKLFCRLLLTVLSICHVSVSVTLCLDICALHLTLTHCIVTLCLREVLVLAGA